GRASLRHLHHFVDDRACCVRLRETSRGLSHTPPLCCVVNQRQNLASQPIPCQFPLGDHRCGAAPREDLRVLALVIVGRTGKRNQDRGTRRRRQLRERRCTR